MKPAKSCLFAAQVEALENRRLLTIDAQAHPAVTNSAFDFHTAHKLNFTFNKDVQASLQPSDVSVVDGVGNPITGPSTVSYDSGTNTATFSFSSILPDGNYTATL